MPKALVLIDPLDPLFISYRQSDGTDIAREAAWLLRSAGIPVWRDRDDQPPGDTDQRLAQAIEEGISGAVLVITPEIAASRVVRMVEAPRLIALHEGYPQFALGIANQVEREPGRLDYSAPDQLLERNPQTLTGVDQHATSRDGLLAVVRQMTFHRVAQCRPLVAADAGAFRISIQTRNTPQVYDRTDSHLDVRVRPSQHERLPSAEGLSDLKDTIAFLPDAVTRADARRVLITGGAHPSVAIALGAALPSSRIGEIAVLDQQGAEWVSGTEASFGSDNHIRVVSEGVSSGAPSGRPAVAVFLDLMETSSPAAFERLLEESAGSFVAWKHLGRATQGLVDPADAGELAAQAAAYIRRASTENDNAEIHLAFRGPFPMAVLAGRLTNTLRVVAYEWDDSDPADGVDWRPRYVPSLDLRTSTGSGVIRKVMLSGTPLAGG